MLQQLYFPGKNPLGSIGFLLGGPQSWYRHYGVEKNLFSLLGIKP
jgi:hypothetical protein